MRVLAVILVGLLVVIQYPLWLGKGGWLQVWRLDRQLDAQRQRVVELQQRNAALAAEVRDLRSGHDAVEERARHDLGLIKPDEMFFKIESVTIAAPRAHPPAAVEQAQLAR